VPLPADDIALIEEFVDSLNAAMPPHMAGRMRYVAQTGIFFR
jgi:hypothetical protein